MKLMLLLIASVSVCYKEDGTAAVLMLEPTAPPSTMRL